MLAPSRRSIWRTPQLAAKRQHSLRSTRCNSCMVLLTREAGKNLSLKKRLFMEGIDSFQCPMVQTIDGPDKHSLVDTITNQQFSWVTITSPESARVFGEAWEKTEGPEVRIASVGKGATVLYPASQRAQHTLQRGLEERGFRVTRLNTYSTEPVTTVAEPVLEEALACAVVAIAAPSALKAWLQVAGEDAAKARPVACIGSTSAKAALALGWREEDVFWPESPGLDGFVESIKDALEQHAPVDAQ